MAPVKNKKKGNLASKSTSQQVKSGKKQLKKRGKAGLATESTSEEVVPDPDKKIKEEKKVEDASESVPTPVVKKKPCTWLKLERLDPDYGKKSSLQSCKQGKEAKPTTQVQAANDNKRKREENGKERGNNDRNFNEKRIDSSLEKKEKGIVNDRHDEETKKRDDESDKKLGGLIFMCNAKTKPDCLNYQLMGVPANKKKVVMGVKPGLTLFLYDYDLKILYGVFEASSEGGMKLEPTAFGGGFPAQVRFIVQKDCLPLPESVFKKAIKDSYDERTRKFKTELTVKQVRNLIDLFRTTPRLHPNSKPMFHEGNPMYPVPATTLLNEEPLMRQRYLNNYPHVFSNTVPPRDPLFLSEQEYRNSGLQQGRHFLPPTAGDDFTHNREPNKLDQELKHLISTDPAVQQREFNQPDPFHLSEKEYRTFGLRGPHQMPDSVKDAYDPYDEATTSLVNRYLSMPMAPAVPAESYPNHMSTHPRTIPDSERAFATYNSHEQSDFNQRPYSLSASREPSVFNQRFGENNSTSAPVSHRYSSSLSQHR